MAALKKTKIICTIGPSSQKIQILKKLIKQGMNCARINIAHGSFPDYQKQINNLRKISNIPIMLDIKGPEIRTRLPNDLPIYKNHLVELYKRNFSYNFFSQIKSRQKILFDDGKLIGTIKKIKGDRIEIAFKDSGIIKPNKSVNLPNIKLKISPLSKKDVEAVKFAIKNKLDFIALSFVRSKKDIINLKELIKKLDKNAEISIISKIENMQGAENIDDIIENSEGIMIARGDMANEIGPEKVPIIQKEIIRKAKIKGKVSIVATQMLETMIQNISPTRAEVSDIANAVFDGADCLMLSGETAIGKHPVECVKVMSKVSTFAEASKKHHHLSSAITFTSVEEAISKSVYELTTHLPINKVVVVTKTGFTAKQIARFRPDQQIIAVSDQPQTVKTLQIVYGIEPYLINKLSPNQRILGAAQFCLKNKLVKHSDLILFTAGLYAMHKNNTNVIHIHKANEIERFLKGKRK